MTMGPLRFARAQHPRYPIHQFHPEKPGTAKTTANTIYIYHMVKHATEQNDYDFTITSKRNPHIARIRRHPSNVRKIFSLVALAVRTHTPHIYIHIYTHIHKYVYVYTKFDECGLR